MRKVVTSVFTVLVLITSLPNHLYSQSSGLNKVAVAACDNEDFEAGPGGAVTNTAAVTGWNIYKLALPNTPFVSNCALYTSSVVTYTNPASAFLFTANGHVDTLLGPNYPVYSVFGSGLSNGGELYNPGISAMYGNSFFRIGNASGIGYNHHCIEKTIQVTAANSLFRFAYLSVVKTGGPSCCDAPAVQVKFLNASQGNAILSCPVYSINAPIAGCLNTTTPVMIATSNTSIPSLGTYYHKWKIAAVDLSPYIGSNITFKMIVTYCATGCAKYGYCYLDAPCSPMEVFVNGIPFPANTNSVTFNGCGVTNAAVVAPPDFGTYSWSGPAGFSSTLSTITTSLAGIYTLNIGTTGTCANITKYINIQLSPNPTVTAQSSTSVICVGNSATLTLGGLTSYSLNGQATPSLASVKPTTTTTYTISGLNSAGCSGSTTLALTVNPCTGIEKNYDKINQIMIFPNPATSSFFLNLDKELSSGAIIIKNALGQNVILQSLPGLSNEIRTTDLSEGIYFYYVIDSNKILGRGKLMIE